MSAEATKKIITEALEKMGCTDLVFLESKENSIIAAFNCKEMTSFIAEIPGWIYSGIQLDLSGERQYKIIFKKLV